MAVSISHHNPRLPYHPEVGTGCDMETDILYSIYHIFETKSIDNNNLRHNKLQMKICKFTIIFFSIST